MRQHEVARVPSVPMYQQSKWSPNLVIIFPSSSPSVLTFMPRDSENRKTLKEAEDLLTLAVLASDSGLQEIALLHYALVADALDTESRYFSGAQPQYHRERDDSESGYFFTTGFDALTDDEFRQKYRTTRYGFSFIAKLIEQHPVFHNNSNNNQVHSAWQLAAALQRLGHYGSHATVKHVATEMGISTGSVIEYTNRVITALLSLVPEWIKWPDEDEREEHGRLMRQEGFPGCVGFIGGTTFPLFQKPARGGSAYFDGKKRYSVNAQIICDAHGRIIALRTGSPGSAADSAVFKRMGQFQHPKKFFSPGEYLLADSAYSLSKYCIPPYRAPAAELPDNTAFNYYIACSHARNEHCIGMLKGRWQSLQGLRHRLHDFDNTETLGYWVISCCVLHNVLAHIEDTWTEESEGESRDPSSIIGSQATIRGTAFREALKKTTLETNRSKRDGP